MMGYLKQGIMIIFVLLFGVILKNNQVCGIDMSSAIPRRNCYPDEQLNCNEDFAVAYPNLSKSKTGLMNATTWFLLFTRNNCDTPELLHKCGGRLPPISNFNPKNRLIVIVLPFLVGICNIAVYREWKVQFLKRGDVNVLVVDYSWGNGFDYEEAIENGKIVSEQVVQVLRNIQEDTGLQSCHIYLIGHSLGAQICGYIGNMISIGRITGIDPAAPGFPEDAPLQERLDRSDADLVDIWHTNAGNCNPNFGINYEAGHIDFWINDGTNQPSCLKYAFASLIRGDFIYGISTTIHPKLCSHAHAAQYYKVSINPEGCQFVGVKFRSYSKLKGGCCQRCGEQGQNCMIMGYDTDKYFKGFTNSSTRYYVHTSMDCPYCDNKFIRLGGFEVTYNSSLQT